MNRKRLAALLVGGLGAVAASNVVLRRRAGDLEPPLPGSRKTYRFRGMDVSYTEAGDGPDVVLLHGISATATSYEWAGVFDALAEDYHVVAPDFPGFGCSDRPPIDYDADRYTDFVRSFATDVTADATCIASSLSGAYAGIAQRDSEPFSRLVLVCPTAGTASRQPWLKALIRSPVVGTGLYHALSSKASIRYFDVAHGYYDQGRIPADEVEYQWRSAHQPGARYAPASFLSGFLDPEVDLASVLSASETPVTLVWGREADLPPLATGRALADAVDARLVVFDRAKLLPHVEYPTEFMDVLSEELPVAVG